MIVSFAYKFSPTILTVAMLCSIGCVNLDKNKPVEGVTSSGKHFQKQAAALKKAGDRRSPGLVTKFKNMLPKTSSPSARGRVIAKDDPTSLQNMPELSPELYTAAARLSQQNGRFKEAMDQYNRALEIDGQNRNALIGLARLNQRAERDDEALRLYQQANTHHPNDPVILNDLGLCYARRGETNAAVSALAGASKAAPDRGMYMNNLASVLVEAGRSDEATSHLTQIQGPANANYTVGYLLDRKGNREAASQYLRRALKLDPTMHNAAALLRKTSPQTTVAAKPKQSQPRETPYPNTLSPRLPAQRVAMIPSQRVVTATRPQPSSPSHAEQKSKAAENPTLDDAPNNGSDTASEEYVIPVVPMNRQSNAGLLYPAAARTLGRIPATIPAHAQPSHLTNSASRVGPFGYVPIRRQSGVHLVSYVEETGLTPVPKKATESAQLQAVATPKLFPLQRPDVSQRELGEAFSPLPAH